MESNTTKHIPVLFNEVMQSLRIRSGQKFLDCTFGGGGHTRGILESAPDVIVVSLDCDPQALERLKPLKAEFGERLKFYDINFGLLDTIPEDKFDGILFDLGVSSFQLDQADRGFSFRYNKPLDMRLDTRSGISAAEFLETASKEELVNAIRNLGEERAWKAIADAIIKARGSDALKTTGSFAELIEKTVNLPKWKRSKIHPATKTFQGIRMAVNDELGQLERALPKAFHKLAIGGILAVISFHSLEDRIVKRYFKRIAGRPEHKFDSRVQEERERYAELVTPKPISPSEDEIKTNPRCRSSKLRILKKERNYSHEI